MSEDLLSDLTREAKELARETARLEEMSKLVDNYSLPSARMRDERGRFIGEDSPSSRVFGNRMRDERGRFLGGQSWDWSTTDPAQRLKFEKQVDEVISKKKREMEATSRGFSRNDVNDIRGTLELIGGDVNAGNIKDAAAVVTGGKSDSMFRRISGPLALGNMALGWGMQQYESRTKQLAEDARSLGENIDLAKRAGITGEQRQAIERQARATVKNELLQNPTYSKINVAGRGFSYLAEKLFGYDLDDEQQKTQAAQNKKLKHMSTAMDNMDEFGFSNQSIIDLARGMKFNRNQGSNNLGITADEIREAQVELLKSIDEAAISNVLAKKAERDAILKKQVEDEKYRRALNPMYEILKRNEEGSLRAQERNRNIAFSDWNKI